MKEYINRKNILRIKKYNLLTKISIFLILVLVIVFNTYISEASTDTTIPIVDNTQKIYDFAGLLTDEGKKEIYNDITEYINTYNMDMVIVTINKNNKSSSMAYADDFYDYNDFGIGSNRDGILFLIDMDNRNMWISTTGKAILMYDDNRIDDILDDTYSAIKNEDYDLCCKRFISSASSWADYGIPSSNSNYYINDKGEYVKKFPFFYIILISFTTSIIFILIAANKHKTVKKAVQAKQYIVKDSLNLTTSEDRFINTHTSRIYSPQSDSSSGGGGGSSTHSSSSGSSHGGGGRSF